MTREELIRIRNDLGKTQQQMAHLLGTSLKAVQSYEQGWRTIPVHVERQVLFLLTMVVTHGLEDNPPCWEVRHCDRRAKEKCPTWELRQGHCCWMVNGTIVEGEAQSDWRKKMTMCRRCPVFRHLFDAR